MPVSFGGVERELVGRARKRRRGLDHVAGDVLLAVLPGAGALDAGAQEGLVPSLEPHAVATGHQKAFGEGRAVAAGWPRRGARGFPDRGAPASSRTIRGRRSDRGSR